MPATTRRTLLPPELRQVFDGLVISDAHLSGIGIGSNSSFRMSVKHQGFAEAVAKLLPFQWSEIKQYFLKKDKRTGKIYTGWHLSSKRDLFLTEQRKRWYPDGKKVVPSDLKLSKELLLWWYLGDGHLARKKSRPEYRRVVLCTDSFKESELDFLIVMLCEELGNNSIYKENKHIIIAKNALCNFINYIGSDCPVPEYEYKFDFGQYKDPYYFKNSLRRSSVLDFGRRMRECNSKPVTCIETMVTYPSVMAAAKAIGYCPSSIINSAKHGRTCAKQHWKYVKQ